MGLFLFADLPILFDKHYNQQIILRLLLLKQKETETSLRFISVL